MTNLSDKIQNAIATAQMRGDDTNIDNNILLIGDSNIKELEELLNSSLFTSKTQTFVNPKTDGGKFTFREYPVYFWYSDLVKLVKIK